MMTLLEKKQYVEENLKLVPEEELRLFYYNFACVLTKNSSCIEGEKIVSVEEVVSITKGHNVKIDETLKRSIYNHFKAYDYMLRKIEEGQELTEEYVKENPTNPNIEKARRELYIAEGSDWFWWYGVPNNSGQDYVFDYMFRGRLKNVYLYLFGCVGS